jgi:hypothetical protein
MRLRQVFPVLRLLALRLLVVGIIAGIAALLSFGVHSLLHFIGNTPSPKRILRVIYCLILVIGITGAGRSLAELFGLGAEGYRERYRNRFSRSYAELFGLGAEGYRERYRNGFRGAVSLDLEYEKAVQKTADCLILVGGALFFLWLL